MSDAPVKLFDKAEQEKKRAAAKKKAK